jgi:rare lipoprotein A
VGRATYYYGGSAGHCAHRTLPFGTVVTVSSDSRGTSTQCVVADRGPFVTGLVIDLDPAEFEQLAPLSAGVVDVRLTW